MKILCADQDDDTLLFFLVYPSQATLDYIARKVKSDVGIGKPFFAFHNASVPSNVLAGPGWDPISAPLVSENEGENAANISAMLADAELQAVPNGKVFAA